MNQKPTRLFSLDALRGFDMFWIMGAEAIFHRLGEIYPDSFLDAIGHQFNHPDWHGFAAYDLIFPLFLFIAGISTPYSIGKHLREGMDKSALLKKVVKRGLVLVLLGVVYNNGLTLWPLSEVRIPSVLGRIGLAYMFANIIYLYAKPMAQKIWLVGLLLGYWLLLTFFAAPGFAAGDLTMQGNIVSYIDSILIPGKLYLGIHDPEGLIATIPAIGTALMGIFTGNLLLKTTKETQMDTVKKLILYGVGALVIAVVWDMLFPINKNLWTSSFAMLCAGISLLLMALFYYIIDVKGYQKWAFFFKVIGMNSILIYMSGRFISWSYSSDALTGWLQQLIGEPFNAVISVIGFVGVQWVFLYFMYKKNVFLKV